MADLEQAATSVAREPARPGRSRFESDAARYAAYLETPAGRLRTDLTFANLQEYLPRAAKGKCALDVGCGTGATALQLARLGMQVALLDESPAMLDLAQRAIAESGVRDHITFKQGDVARLAETLSPRSFDVALCHNLLEYVDDPGAVLPGLVRLLRNGSSLVSILVRNQAGEVLKSALQAGDLAKAESDLGNQWGRESLYGGNVRLFTPESLDVLCQQASLAVIARRGVRVISDHLPEHISRSVEYERMFGLERKLGSRQEFVGVARYLHWLARPAVNR